MTRVPTEMRALVLSGDGLHLRHDYPVPRPRRGYALIQVLLAGVCATDLELVAGYKGGHRGVLGHEFVGQVVAAPSAEEWIGRRVVGELNVGCGECDLCRRGLQKHCRRRQCLGIAGLDGAFADYLVLPAANLHPVPADLPDEHAVFVEPLAAALQVLEQVHVRPEERVYVLGDGRLGLLVAQAVARTGCDLIAIGRHPEKLAILSRRGISTAVSSNPPDILGLEALAADMVVEATGSPAGFGLARRLVRPGGILVLKSTYGDSISEFDLSSLVVDEIHLVGSRCGPFQPALRLLQNGAIAVDPMIHGRYGLEESVAALTHAGQNGVLKILVEP